MTAKRKAVFGICQSVAEAERAVNALIADGFASENVSALMPDHGGPNTLVHSKETKAPEGVSAGATTGGVIGGTLGVLIGLGALAIPGVGPLLAAGPIVAGLAGLGAGGAVGGLVGGLVGLGIPEYEARRYEGHVKGGGVLLSVHCDTPGEVLRAKEILQGSGATDIASSGERSGASTRTSADSHALTHRRADVEPPRANVERRESTSTYVEKNEPAPRREPAPAAGATPGRSTGVGRA